MAGFGSILIADHDKAFRESTSRLLEGEGLECSCAENAEQAVMYLNRCRYDLLMADICMPGNSDLSLVREARKLDHDMSVILLTGYPSIDTTIRALELSVAAYLVKPLNSKELVRSVRRAVGNSRRWQMFSDAREGIRLCLLDLEKIERQRVPGTHELSELVSIPTVRRLAASLSALLEIVSRSGAGRDFKKLCELLDCPQVPVCRCAIVETIEVLKETKHVFKSKLLADLRVRLEATLGSGQGTCSRK